MNTRGSLASCVIAEVHQPSARVCSWPARSAFAKHSQPMPDLPIGIEELRYQVTDRDGYWWMECGACDADWQVPHYAEESLG